jgi:hypothetical protein
MQMSKNGGGANAGLTSKDSVPFQITIVNRLLKGAGRREDFDR